MTGSNIIISVIIRTLNREKHLAEAIDSLTRQTLKNFELVVVDMSPDSFTDIINKFRDQIPAINHIKVGHPVARGEALNIGIRAAIAEQIAILDDDNIYYPDHLTTLVDGLKKTGADLAYTGIKHATYTRDGQPLISRDRSADFEFARLIFQNYIYTTGTTFWKSIWQKVGEYNARFTIYEDWDLLLRVAAGGKIAHLPQITAESRSFTGIPDFQEHNLSIRYFNKCYAGILWEHRRFHTAENIERYIELIREKSLTVYRDRHRKRWWLNYGWYLDCLPSLLLWWLAGEKRS